MGETAVKAVEKFKEVSDIMLSLEAGENWYSKELALLDSRRHNFGLKDFEYYELLYQLKHLVMQIILESLKQ